MTNEVLVIGLNHATAPVEIREKVTFSGDETGKVTRSLLEIEGVRECMILSTCNRAEIIATTSGDDTAGEKLVESIGRIHGVNLEILREYLYVKRGSEAVTHVFRVASSLDSMVVGEPQILGQVKDAYRHATVASSTGPILNRLMHKSFFTAKRVRNETGVGIAAVSVAYVAVELARKILGDLSEKSVLLVGAGEMADLAARHLTNQVNRPMVVVNRSYENAICLARELEGAAMAMEKLEDGLTNADVVITSTASCDPLINVPQMKKVMRRRRYRPIFLIDIAIPRDVEPHVNDLDGVYLYNIDDLQTVVEENLGERRQEALRGETLVGEEVMKFMDWTRTLESAPTIVAFKEKLETIRRGELARINGKLSLLSEEDREAVEILTRSIINKIAHDPIVFLKRTGSLSKSNLYLDVAQRMFKLDRSSDSVDNEEEEPRQE